MKRFLTVIFAAVMCLMLLSASVVSFAAEEPELVKKTVDFDMSKYEKGTDAVDTELNDWFFIFYAGPADYSQIVLADDGVLKFNNYIHFAMFPELAEDLMKNGYEISLEYRAKSNADLTGMFLRAVDSRSYEVINPVFDNQPTRIDMYEYDWYKENKGTTASKSSIGGSGIRVYQDAANHKIGVDIKSRETDGIGTASWGVEFDYPEGYVENELNPWKFIDDGKGTIEIYVCESLICKVLYSGEPDTYPDGLNEDCENLYYKTGKIVSPDGTELLSIDNARISADTPCFGIGNRPEPSAITNIRGLSISYFEKPKPTAAPTAEPTEVPTDSDGDATAAPSDATTVPAKATEAPKADSSNNTVLVVGIVIGVIVLALIAVIAVILGKKKK